jgi:hypothetical protein
MSNNKQSMKLYTEEDLIKAIAFGFGICHKEDRAPFNKEMIEFIGALEPTKNIELPTDEEIEKLSWIYTFNKFGEVDDFIDARDGFEDGVKWLLNKVQGDNK